MLISTDRYLARPSSTISTSSAEYHTPSYVSSGEERGLAGGDDSEFSEMDDFTFTPNMAAIWSQNCINTKLTSTSTPGTNTSAADSNLLPSNNTSFSKNIPHKKQIRSPTSSRKTTDSKVRTIHYLCTFTGFLRINSSVKTQGSSFFFKENMG